MIVFPRTPQEAVAAAGEFRAGGTDVQERLRSGVSAGPVIDLRELVGLDGIRWEDGGWATVGALVPIAALAADGRMRRSYPALVEAADRLATPQIRQVGTVGGNLLQRTRCWYYRHPATSCFKKGGDSCPARTGNHLHGVCFDLGPCVAPHPSTLAMVLLAYDARVDCHGGPPRPIAGLLGDGRDPRTDHRLAPGELLTSIRLPPANPGERAAYFRMMARADAEWPLVEAAARLGVRGGAVRFARVTVGAVAPVPLRLRHVEELLVGQPATGRTLRRAAAASTRRADPLPMTGYKVDLLAGTVLTTLEQALAAGP
jgi:xanthine dehydrogenase YagS FAD-binding subunit